ncbi:MAG: MFS transporter [Desulfobacterales bacterium]
MYRALTLFSALFAAVFCFGMGNGLLNSQLSLRMTLEGFSTLVTGLILTCYFIGLLCGYFLCHRLIERVGHIRAFAAFAALGTALVLLHSLYISAIFWALLRFFTGIIVFGLFMVIESWLNECADDRNRGRVFSIYMILTYLALGIGQQFLNLSSVTGPALFSVAALLISLSLVPVAASAAVHPQLPRHERYTFRTMFQKAPLGMLGCMMAGLLNSAFYALMPVVGIQIGLTVFRISWLMTSTILGGLAIQWMIGVLSDRVDRSLILLNTGILISLSSALIAALIGFGSGNSYPLLLVEMGCFGGLLFTIYPVSVARAYDLFAPEDSVAVSAALLLWYSIGAICGPIAASLLITALKSPLGLFVHWSAFSALFVAITIYLRHQERIAHVPVADQVDFIPLGKTSPVAMVIDPRAQVPPPSGTP